MAGAGFSIWENKNHAKVKEHMNSVNGRCPGRVSPKTIVRRTIKVVASTSVITLTLMVQSVMAQSNASTQPVVYGTQDYADNAWNRRVYGGIGLGLSSLQPDTSDVTGEDVKESGSAGAQLTFGADLNKWFSVEAHMAALGEAGLTSGGSIGYQTLGLSALAYAGKNRHYFNRQGFSGYGRLGFGLLKNDPSPEINFEQVNGAHLLLGAGLEFASRKGLAVRGEIIAFDTDVRYGQLSLLYRFGNRERVRESIVEAPTPVPVSKPAPVIAKKPAPVIAPIPAVAVRKVDTDVDGVNDTIDRCPNTQPGVAVDNVGCDLFSGVIEGVNFNSGSADLTPNAQGILSGVVSTLNKFPSVKLTIMAHTDNQGDSNANKNLSKQRARSVAVFLVRNGVSASRLKAFGYGEDRPMDTNDTAQGRSRNRRVEFSAER